MWHEEGFADIETTDATTAFATQAESPTSHLLLHQGFSLVLSDLHRL